MKILVTGGAGFIGSALIRHLLTNTKYMVVNVDCLTYAGNLDSLASVSENDNYSFENVDICNYEALDKVFSKHKPDKVMHLAAESHVDRSITTPSAFISTNIVGTYNLLEISRKHWDLMPTRTHDFCFHHISTDEVYGDLANIDDFFTEETSYSPSSPYSASKASSDHLVRAWHRTFDLPILITNCSNNYGPYHFPEKLIPLTILNALKGNPITVYGKGNQIRDWLFVEDHARALMEVLLKGKIGRTYNIGGNNEKRNIDVVNHICDILEDLYPQKLPGINSYRDLIIHIADRPGHDKRYAIDASRIKNELGWSPKESFETGIYKTVKWYIENEQWWQKILDRS